MTKGGAVGENRRCKEGALEFAKDRPGFYIDLYRQLNTAIRYCVLKGLAGNIFHLGHGGVPKTRTRLWSAMRGSERAVNAWYPDWAAGEDVPLKAEAGEGVEFGMRRHGDRFVLIAVNLSRFERILRFEDPLLRTERTYARPC